MSYLLIGDSGTVRLERTATVTSEGVSLANSATKNPIEKGGQINDHAVTEPAKLSIKGICADMTHRATLEAMLKNRELLTYRGKEALDNLLLTSLSFDHAPDNRDGFTFSASLQVMTITTAAYAPVTGPTMTRMDDGGNGSNKAKSKAGLTTTATDYGTYVSQYDSPAINPSVGDGRTNPAYPGYGESGSG